MNERMQPVVLNNLIAKYALRETCSVGNPTNYSARSNRAFGNDSMRVSFLASLGGTSWGERFSRSESAGCTDSMTAQ